MPEPAGSSVGTAHIVPNEGALKAGRPDEGLRRKPLSSLVAGWRSGRGSLPATPAGVEICAVAVFLGVRMINVGQLAVFLPTALRNTTSPWLFTAVLACYVAESGILGVAVVRAGAYRDQRWGLVDTCTAALVLLTQPAFIAPGDITGSWTAWGYACTLGTACGAGIVFRRRRATALAVAALIGGYLVGSLPLATGQTRTTVIANAFSYVGFAVLTRLLMGFLRRLGSAAEEARTAAAEAAAEAARLTEVDRQRSLLHDNITVLRLLARTDLPQDVDEPLRSQATSLANKVRAFLDDAAMVQRPPAPGAAGSDADAGCELTSVVHAAAEGFHDLHMVFSLDLAEGVVLGGRTAAAVKVALITLFHNVRLHAAAENVVLHADVNDDAAEWEITVSDDGCGFDPATKPPGYGLRVQVTEALSLHHIRVDLRSHPGDGTTFILRGPLGADL
jgi:hypothetical protein